MRTILLTFISIFTTSTLFAHSIQHTAKELVTNLESYQQTISVKHAKTIQQSLTTALNMPNFIDTICQGNHDCLSGSFSFSNEALGLVKALEAEKYYIKACHQDVSCIYATDNYIHDMVNADIGQVKYVLQQYLRDN